MRSAKLLPESRFAPDGKSLLQGAPAKSSGAASKSSRSSDEHDIRQFDPINRANLWKALIWLCKQGHQHKYWPAQFGGYLEEFILPLTHDSSCWKVKNRLKEDGDVQDLVKANAGHLLEFMRIASHYRGCYIGFSQHVAQEVIINGELEALKPPPKAPEPKKKGKKGDKKAKPPAAAMPSRPPPVVMPIAPSKMIKFFFQSLQIVSLEQSQTDGMQGHIKSLGELSEFFYRIALHVYGKESPTEEDAARQGTPGALSTAERDASTLSKKSKTIQETTTAEDFEQVMDVAFKAAGMSVEIVKVE